MRADPHGPQRPLLGRTQHRTSAIRAAPARGHAQHLDTHELSGRVEIDHYARRDFLGFGDLRAVRGKARIKGVSLRVVTGPHHRVALLSKRAVTARISAPSARCTTRNIRPPNSAIAL